MTNTGMNEIVLKEMLKEALVEVLEERRDFFREVVEEVLGDFELVEDLREVKKTERQGKQKVFAMLEGEA